MELEKERGISVTSSVLQFDYRGHAVNLLDTPGHQDFSEDTYRTLSAADSAVMLIDAAKGVEPQTKKLFEVCRMRGIPIFTFVNKLDRYGRAPLELMDELEQVLGIRAYPMNWPIGMGPEFRGVYDRAARVVHVFTSEGTHGEAEVGERSVPLDSPEISQVLARAELAQLREDIELLDVGGDAFDREKSDRGQITPMFFGSAMTNFGVRPVPRRLPRARARRPRPRQHRPGSSSRRPPTLHRLRLQDPGEHGPGAPRPHRLRARGLRPLREGDERPPRAARARTVRLAKPSQFMAAERTAIEEAWPGDVIGLFDPGLYRIGDTLVEGEPFGSRACRASRPSTSPWSAARTRCGASRWRRASSSSRRRAPFRSSSSCRWACSDPIVGVVGALQFEVLQYRIEHEYGAAHRARHAPLRPRPLGGGRAASTRSSFDWEGNRQTVQDRDGLPLVLFRDDWALQHAQEKHPELQFLAEAPQLHEASRVAAAGQA